jgi:hypothetical protein
METITRNVSDLAAPERSALERVVGHPLRETQQIILNVLNLELAKAESAEPNPLTGPIPDYWKVYEGLDDKRIEELTTAINQRANLTRSFE